MDWPSEIENHEEFVQQVADYLCSHTITPGLVKDELSKSIDMRKAWQLEPLTSIYELMVYNGDKLFECIVKEIVESA